MNIGFLTSIYNIDSPIGGGLKTYITHFPTTLAKLGHHITIITCDPPLNPPHPNINIINLGNFTPFTNKHQSFNPIFLTHRLIYFAKAAQIYTRIKLDIIEAADTGFEHLFCSFIPSHHRPKIITRLHGHTSTVKNLHFAHFSNVLEKIAVTRSDGIISPTTSYRQVATTLYGQIDHKITTISNPCYTNTNSNPIDILHSFHLPPNPLILFVGNTSPIKNFNLFIRLASSNISSKVTFVALGENLGHTNTNLLPPNLFYLGHQPPSIVASFYQQASLLISTSQSEVCPMNILEAMTHGLPIIASRISGNRDLVKHNQNGFLFTPNSLKKLNHYFNKLIEHPQLQQQFSQKSIKLSQQYHPDYIAQKTLEYYSHILEQS